MRINLDAWFRRGADPEPVPPASAAPGLSASAAPGLPASAAPVRNVQERVVDSVPVTYMESAIPEVDSAYGYGHLDGRRGVPPENFRGFIRHTVDGEGIERRLAELQADEQALRQRAADVRQRRSDLAAGTETLRALREREAHWTAEVRDAEAVLAEAEASARQHERGSYGHALMYLGAGALFVFGAVVMTRKIVADALQLTGHRFLGLMDESWVFAAGLAMISIVLKPAYDRLVEKPFWNGREKPFLAVILLLTIGSLGTLWVLGEFRAEAYGDQQRLLIIQQAEGLSDAEKLTRITALQETMLESELATLSFVLSGLLFATAGAVTLSIGTRYLRSALHERRPARKRVLWSEKVLKDAQGARMAAVAALAAHAEGQERVRAIAVDDVPAAELEARADAVAEQRRELSARFVAARQHRLLHLYDDGYELGGLARVAVEVDEARAAAAAPRRRKRPRPFIALRRAIRERALTPETLN
jgi:hypothetical protein